MKSFETTSRTKNKRTKLSRGTRLAFALSVLAPSAVACGEAGDTIKVPPAAAVAAPAPAHPQINNYGRATRMLTEANSPVKAIPEVTQPETQYAKAADIEQDIQSMVTMIDAMDPYNRDDIKVNTTGNPDGTYTQSLKKTTLDNNQIPTVLSVSVVYGLNPEAATSGLNDIHGVSMRVYPFNTADDYIRSTSTVLISSLGDKDWSLNASDNGFAYVNATTESMETPMGKSNVSQLTSADEQNITAMVFAGLADLNSNAEYIPPARGAAHATGPEVTGVLAETL